jgi:hypothetical protein
VVQGQSAALSGFVVHQHPHSWESQWDVLHVSLGSLTPFLNLRTEERRLRQATALLLMRRTCNL